MRSRKPAEVPVVHRTARVALRLTRGQARRCYGMLRSGGDVWAALIELNTVRFRRRGRPLLGFFELCRHVAGTSVGELSITAIRSVIRCYSDACLETARRKQRGERARYPRRRKALMPLCWYAGTFELQERRVRISMAKGSPDCWLRLARSIPYADEQVRSVTLLAEGGRLYLDVTAEVPVQQNDLDPARVAGVDLGIIHPYAVVGPADALVVSGRAVRSEERLHLADTKARAARMGRKAPRRGQRGSRRWRHLRDAQRRAEARNRRRVHQAQHEAAKAVVAWAAARRIGTLVIGDPKGITRRDAGRRQNRRLRQWRRTHLASALIDKAALAGMTVVLVDERGTSSSCPHCQARQIKPRGRVFSCSTCGLVAHRDVVGATNIAALGGGSTSVPALVTHRRAGVVPARRDRRRQLMDERRRFCPAPGRPGDLPEVARRGAVQRWSYLPRGPFAPHDAAPDEDPLPPSSRRMTADGAHSSVG